MPFTKMKAESQKPKTVESEITKFCALRFTFLAFVTLLAVSIFVIGCPPVKPEPDKVPSPKPEPNKVQITEPEPNKAKIAEPEPNDVEPPKAEPNDIEPNDIEPNQIDPNVITTIPKVSFHDKCVAVLKAFVDDEGMVNYKKLKRKKSQLSKLLDEFAKLDPNEYDSWPKEDKIAFWLNAYNIQRLKIIVDNYPIKSSRWGRVFWWPPSSIRYIDKNIGYIDKQKFFVRKEEFTLARIEERFFFKEFDEPRVFFALSLNSLSSPHLRNEPYYGYKLDEQLNDQAKKFLSSSHAFRIDRKKKRVYLSAKLKPTSYGKKFIAKHATNRRFKDQPRATRAVLNFVTNYISEQDVFFLEKENYSVKYIRYDWRINDSSGSK
jgi:hypothetical protein